MSRLVSVLGGGGAVTVAIDRTVVDNNEGVRVGGARRKDVWKAVAGPTHKKSMSDAATTASHCGRC